MKSNLLWSYHNFKTYVGKPQSDKPHPILECEQVHGHRIVSFNRLLIKNGATADGIYWNQSPSHAHWGVDLAIRTADCLPLALLSEDERSFGAILHCGWRSLAQGIIPCLTKFLPAKEYPLQKLILGACIGPCCFEVGEEVGNQFPPQFSVGKHLDLASFAIHQVLQVYPIQEIIRNTDCTRCRQEYPSYRRDKTNLRLWNIYEL